MTQAVTYKTNIDKIQHLFGGSVRAAAPPKLSTNNQVYKWRLCAQKASDFCERILPYTLLKHQQVKIGAEYKSNRGGVPMTVTTPDGKVYTSSSVQEMAQLLGFKYDKTWRLKAPYLVTRGDKQEARRQQSKLREQLVALKKTEHCNIEAELDAAYVAGLIDADGCLQHNNISAVQKHPSIIHALQKKFGGRVYHSSSHRSDMSVKYAWQWTARGAHMDSCLAIISPFLVGKAPQAQLLHGPNKDISAEGKRRLTDLKMHKRG